MNFQNKKVLAFSSGASPVWITLPNALDVTLACSDAAGLKTAQAMKPVARNSCDSSPLTLVKTSGPFVPTACPQAGTYTNQWIATDNCGNSSEIFTQIITIVNNTVPVISPLPALSIQHCNDTPNFTYPTVTVGCDLNISLTYVDVNVPGDCPSSYKTTRTWTARDGCGNTSQSVSQTISFVDETGPVITTPKGSLDRNLQCSDEKGLNDALALTPEAVDECSATVIIHLTADNSIPIPGTLSDYVRVRKWNFTDACGNLSSEFTQNITVADTIKPTIIAPPAVSVYTDPGKCSATGVDLGKPVTADNCAIAAVTNNAVEPFLIGSTTVTWTVLDGSGNFSTATQVVTVIDTIRPVITAPAPVIVGVDPGKCSATGVITGNPVTSDNCSVASVSNDAVEPFALGNTTVTWTVTDASGNTSTVKQLITVVDSLKPSIIAPTDVSVTENLNECGVRGLDLGIPATSDNCSIVSVTNNAVEPYLPGKTSVTWTATDASGNTATAIQVITVIDNQFPLITAPAPVIVNTDPGKNTASGVALGQPVTSDNCPTTVKNDAAEPFHLGKTTVNWSVTDTYGNKTSTTQDVMVIDNENPKFISCSSQTANTDPGLKTYLLKAEDWNSIVTDNDTVVSLTCNLSGATQGNGSSFRNIVLNIGITTIVLTATDRTGNTNTCTFTFTVKDNENPQFINCISDEEKIFKTGFGNSAYLNNGNSLDLTAKDNDSLKSVSYTLSGVTTGTGVSLNGVSFNVGETDVIWTATDLSANTTSCFFKVLVQDSNLPPVPANNHFVIGEGKELNANVFSNDSDLNVSAAVLRVNLLTGVSHGKLTLKGDGSFTYLPNRDFIGDDQYSYQLCSIENPSLCSTALATITVIKNEDCSVEIPDSFSPNGDGINDYFKIGCIYNYPEANLKIYTRSGVLVYEQKNYGNVDFWGSEQQAWWDGRTNNRWNVGGSKLAASTYIYLLELDKANKGKVLSGTIFLNY